jgi:hypothetical protein
MTKAILFFAAILACTGLAVAQETPSAGTSNQSGSTASQPADQNNGSTIQGCLTGTSGNYTLTDAMGMSYRLQGDDSQLSQNVNKEVEVTGTVASEASASSGNTPESGTQNQNPSTPGESNPNAGAASGSTGGNATTSAAKTLDVNSVKTVADNCNSSK